MANKPSTLLRIVTPEFVVLNMSGSSTPYEPGLKGDYRYDGTKVSLNEYLNGMFGAGWRSVLLTPEAGRKYDFVANSLGAIGATRFTFDDARDFIENRTRSENWIMVRVTPGSLKKLQEKETKGGSYFMKDNAIIPADTQLVDVQFQYFTGELEPKDFTYRVHSSIAPLVEGDVVLVQTHDNEINIAKVTHIYAKGEIPAAVAERRVIKYAFQKVDTALNDTIVKARERRFELKQQLQQLAVKVQERKILEELLAGEPEAEGMLEEMRKLESM